MAQIVPYNGGNGAGARREALPNVQQRAPDVGFGREVGQGLQAVAQGLGNYAEGVKQFQERQDNASVAELDAAFSDRARQIQTDYLNTSGKSALDDRPKADDAWSEAAKEFAGRTVNPRQGAMFNALVERRRQDWLGTADTHRNREVEVYQDTADAARAAALGNDATILPDGPERNARLGVQEQIIRAMNARKGLDPSVADAAVLAARTVVHQNTVGGLIETGDPRAAQAYLDKYADQIEPQALTRLRTGVREQVYEFDAGKFWEGQPKADPDHSIVAPAADGSGARSFQLRPPVSAAMGSRFGPRHPPGGVGSSNHRGVDYPVPVNTPVVASGPGVVRLKNDPNGYGQYVVVDHGGGWETRYAHVSAFQVRDGQTVDAGEVLALSGGARGAAGAGNSQGPHVHYEVRHNGVAENPERQIGRTVAGQAREGNVVAEAMPRTLEDVYASAREEAKGDWRYQRILEQRGVARYSQERAIQEDRERQAWDAVQPYLPDGANAVTDINQIPQAVRSRLSPQALNSVSGQIRVANTREEKGDPVVQDQTFNALMDIAASPATANTFNGLNLDEYAPSLSRAQLNSLKAHQRSARNEATPQNQTVQGRAAASLTGMTALKNRYLANIGVETGDKATPEDARTTAQFNDAIMRSVQTFITTNNRAPTDTEMTGMMANLTREVIVPGERTGLFGLGGPETRRAFQGAATQSAIPSPDRAAIVAQFRRSGVTNPTPSQIDAAYRLGLNRGTFQPPEE